MADNEAEEGDPNVDDDGIQIQTYTAMVLVVVPPKEFAEQTLRHARSSLYNVHVGTKVVGVSSSNRQSTRRRQWSVERLRYQLRHGELSMCQCRGESFRTLIRKCPIWSIARYFSQPMQVIYIYIYTRLISHRF